MCADSVLSSHFTLGIDTEQRTIINLLPAAAAVTPCRLSKRSDRCAVLRISRSWSLVLWTNGFQKSSYWLSKISNSWSEGFKENNIIQIRAGWIFFLITFWTNNLNSKTYMWKICRKSEPMSGDTDSNEKNTIHAFWTLQIIAVKQWAIIMSIDVSKMCLLEINEDGPIIQSSHKLS